MQCLILQTLTYCASITGKTCNTGTISAFTVATPQPVDTSLCINILASSSELSSAMWSLTASQGSTIALKIASVWAVAWVFRAIIFQLKQNEGNQNE